MMKNVSKYQKQYFMPPVECSLRPTTSGSKNFSENFRIKEDIDAKADRKKKNLSVCFFTVDFCLIVMYNKTRVILRMHGTKNHVCL